jgi:hypothetical protein
VKNLEVVSRRFHEQHRKIVGWSALASGDAEIGEIGSGTWRIEAEGADGELGFTDVELSGVTSNKLIRVRVGAVGSLVIRVRSKESRLQPVFVSIDRPICLGPRATEALSNAVLVGTPSETSLDGLAPGNYQVVATCGGEMAVASVDVRPGEQSETVVFLDTAAAIRFRAPAPLPELSVVRLSWTTIGSSRAVRQSITHRIDRDLPSGWAFDTGSPVVAGLTKYRVSIARPQREQFASDFEVVADGEVSLEPGETAIIELDLR